MNRIYRLAFEVREIVDVWRAQMDPVRGDLARLQDAAASRAAAEAEWQRRQDARIAEAAEQARSRADALAVDFARRLEERATVLTDDFEKKTETLKTLVKQCMEFETDDRNLLQGVQQTLRQTDDRQTALKAVLARLDDASSTLTVRCQETSQQVQRLETAQGEAMRHSDRTFRESERQAEAVRADFEGFERRWERRLDEARRRSDESVFQAAFQGLFH